MERKWIFAQPSARRLPGPRLTACELAIVGSPHQHLRVHGFDLSEFAEGNMDDIFADAQRYHREVHHQAFICGSTSSI